MQRHHPTGSAHGAHLDPELVFRLDAASHHREHAVRRGLRLDRGARADTGLARVELRLRRLAVFFTVSFAPRLADDSERAFVESCAAHLVSWADELAAHQQAVSP